MMDGEIREFDNEVQKDILKTIGIKGAYTIYNNEKYRGFGKTTFLTNIHESNIYMALGYDKSILLQGEIKPHTLRGLSTKTLLLVDGFIRDKRVLDELYIFTDCGGTVVGFIQDSTSIEEKEADKREQEQTLQQPQSVMVEDVEHLVEIMYEIDGCRYTTRGNIVNQTGTKIFIETKTGCLEIISFKYILYMTEINNRKEKIGYNK